MAGNTITYDEFLKDYLSKPEDLAAYINTSMEEGQLMTALGNVARVYGIGKLSQEAKLNRENLYKMLSETGNPSLTNLTAILNSIGLQMKFEPKPRSKPKTPARKRVETKSG